jgi:hypothetical protein
LGFEAELIYFKIKSTIISKLKKIINKGRLTSISDRSPVSKRSMKFFRPPSSSGSSPKEKETELTS